MWLCSEEEEEEESVGVDECVLPLLAAVKHSSAEQEHSSMANQVTSILFNIRSIPTHFVPKVDAWAATNQVGSLSPEQASALELCMVWL